VARDGRQFRRSWEQRLDPAHRPTLPAAVRTYDASGETKCVAFDLDAKKKATRGAVLRDCERLTAWLSEAGCSYLVDESVSGGRHVYVLLDHKVSHSELAPLARHLRSAGALPTLDPGPLVNLTEGCIRPPGATHRDGGHQRLITPMDAVYRALNRRTSAAAWAAFLAQLPAIEDTRRTIDLHSPAAGDAVTGPRRPLANSYATIATTGAYDPRRYPSASEARAAVLLHALCRGWTERDIQDEVRQGRWAGLTGLYREHYGSRYAGTALASDITRAQARLHELPLHRIHTSATRPRGGGGTAARTHLRRWAAAVAIAVRTGRWDSQKSYGIELVLTALGDAARRTQTIYPAFGVRHLSMGTGTVVEQSGLAKTLKVLASEDDPFVLLVDSDRGVEPDVYELRIPDQYLEDVPIDEDLPPAPIGVHPAFSLLPRPAYRLHTALSHPGEPRTPAELASATAMPLRTVYATLTELERAGLARRRAAGTWALGRRSLTRFARLNGIAGRLHDLVRRWRQERNALRLLHGLEEIHYPAAFTVAWPGMPHAGASPPEQARPTPEEILHAADPPRPDWVTDLEAAVLELLRTELGATLIEPDEQATG
jgi:DNA-binding transcriptional ArsR family regulator